MKRIAFVLVFFISIGSVFPTLSNLQVLKIEETFKSLSAADLREIIMYLYTATNLSLDRQKSEILLLAQNVLKEKMEEFYKSLPEDSSQELAQTDAKLYRTQQIALSLERILGREVFLNQDEAFVLSHGTPILYQERTGTFYLKPYKMPDIDPDLYKGPIATVFEESLKYPNYAVLFWSPTREEYILYSVEYDKVFHQSDLDELSDDQVVILFGKVFPVSLEKPAWAWKIFGLTSIKREIKNLLEKEKQNRISYSN